MKKGDILIIALLCVVCVAWFCLGLSGGGATTAEIWHNGEKLVEIELDSVKEAYTYDVGGCKLLIKNGCISFSYADCPDGLCVKGGKLCNAGDTMACVPNRVVVTVTTSKSASYDAVTY